MHDHVPKSLVAEFYARVYSNVSVNRSEIQLTCMRNAFQILVNLPTAAIKFGLFHSLFNEIVAIHFQRLIMLLATIRPYRSHVVGQMGFCPIQTGAGPMMGRSCLRLSRSGSAFETGLDRYIFKSTLPHIPKEFARLANDRLFSVPA
jgi:hypothetical protein